MSKYAFLCCLLPLVAACETDLDWLVVESEVQELCIVDLSSEFDGISELATGVDGIVSRVFGNEDLGITLSDKFSTKMYLRGVGIYADDGIDDFGFIDSLRVEVSTAGGQAVELLSANPTANRADWFVASDSGVDIATYFESEDMQLLVEFVGSMPEVNWSANLEVCVRAEAAYRESL